MSKSKFLLPETAKHIVLEITAEVEDFIEHKLEAQDEEHRELLKGRIFNLILSHHFDDIGKKLIKARQYL